MADITAGPASETKVADTDHHEYHSAVELDETEENWRDWVGPALSIAFLIAAIAALAYMLSF